MPQWVCFAFNLKLTAVCQFTRILSSKNFFNWGAPQGAVLGPTPFLIFINDMLNVVKALPRIDDFVENGLLKTQATIPLFADDTTLVCVAPTEQLFKSTINAAMSRIYTEGQTRRTDKPSVSV